MLAVGVGGGVELTEPWLRGKGGVAGRPGGGSPALKAPPAPQPVPVRKVPRQRDCFWTNVSS